MQLFITMQFLNRIIVPLVLILGVVLFFRLTGSFVPVNTVASNISVKAQDNKPASATQQIPDTPSTISQIRQVSALDTAQLLNFVEQEVEVRGTPTHIEYTRPKSNPEETWACLFFNENGSADIFPGYTANQSPWDYMPYFKIIVKPYIMDRYSMSLLLNCNISCTGIIDYYIGAPVIILKFSDQIKITD